MAYKILHDLASAFPSPLCLIPGAAATTTAFLFSTAKFAAALSDLCQGCFSVPCPSPLYQLPPSWLLLRIQILIQMSFPPRDLLSPVTIFFHSALFYLS